MKTQAKTENKARMVRQQHRQTEGTGQLKAGGVQSPASQTGNVKGKMPPGGARARLRSPAPEAVGQAFGAPGDSLLGSIPVVASGTSSFGKATLEVSRSFSGDRLVRSAARKQRLLWIGDAVVPTGFATVTHSVLKHLRHEWDVVVSGVNYDGADHGLPYQVLPAWQGADMWGINRFQHLCAEVGPAAVIINSDWWNVAQFVRAAPRDVPLIAYMPVDGAGLDPAAMQELNKLSAAVWYTDFGHREAVRAGFQGARHVIPHGIDTTLFQTQDRAAARRALGLAVPEGAFIVGNLNRNQPRKRLDLTIEIFADWVRGRHVPDAFLLLHCALKDTGWDLRRIAAHHGVADRLLLTGSDAIRDLQDAAQLRLIYNSLDVQMTTTLGEGWGLTTMEGMACGIPQIVPDSSALAEWAAPAVKIPCTRSLWHPEINTIGALVDHAPFVEALDRLHKDKGERARLSAAGMQHVKKPEFGWCAVARQFDALAAGVAKLERNRS